jgi:transaldolase/glucose-6-phosphate isomerase
MNNPAIEVQQYGQSLWLDYIHRTEIKNGEMQRRIDEEGILGVTSNPAIFQKAIGDSSTYDEAMRQMLELDAEAVYEALAIEDIQGATDLFRPIYDKTNGQDGYVSLEVSPLLAHDAAASFAEAKRLFAAINRPNLMIKIPGTPESFPAIEAAIAEGININVTLLFSVQNYEQIAEAFIKGLERRLEAGEAIDKVASVASFFLSRIDNEVDRILENNIRVAQVHGNTTRIAANRKLLGQAAIANAKLAYRSFLRIFRGERWKKLAEHGAMVQRPLWASTSTKNPAYKDTLYLDQLIGKHTVNTVPPNTLAAFIDHGQVAETLSKDDDHYLPPDEVMDKLAELSIDIEQVTHRLQVDGVEAFTDAFETLLDQVKAKLTVLKTGIMERQKLAYGIYAEAVNKAIKQIDKDFVNGRLWSKDGSIWTSYNPDINKIEQRLGWLDVLDTVDLERLKTLQASIKDSDFTHLVLLGMGGSSLAPEVLFKTFGQQAGFPALIVLDSTDPARIREIEARIDLSKTLFIVASKSGGTVETLSFYRYFWQQTKGNAEQFIAITDPNSDLARLAEECHFRDCFLNPADIGGRYSALSYFGMVPAALIGIDLEQLWQHTRHMIVASNASIPGQYHPGITLGALIGVLAEQGRDKLTIYTTESFRAFGDWAEQLLAESLGKLGKGVVPVVGSEITSPASYVTDRLFVYLRVDNDSDVEDLGPKITSLREAGHPRAVLSIPNKYGIAGEFFRWEFATAIAGHLMKLNPFDEPNVSEAKQATNQKLDHFRQHGRLPQSTPIISGGRTQLYIDETTIAPLRELCHSHGYDSNSRKEVLAAQMAGTHAGDYFAFLCYFTPDDQALSTLHEIQTRLRNVTKRAVTIGFGPRYLHSTGQLHKGGANNGIFFQITHKPTVEDIAIPEQDYSFQTLFDAQAAGDLETLQKHNRHVIRFHIEEDLQEGLQKLIDAIKFVEERRF